CGTDSEGGLAWILQPIHPDEGTNVFSVHCWNISARYSTSNRATPTLSPRLCAACSGFASSFARGLAIICSLRVALVAADELCRARRPSAEYLHASNAVTFCRIVCAGNAPNSVCRNSV